MSSSHRSSGKIDILAMLEGRSGRPLAKRMPALPAALWYGSAGLLACALVWLAREADVPDSHRADAAAVAPAQQEASAPDAMAAAGFAGYEAADNSMTAHMIQDEPVPERSPAADKAAVPAAAKPSVRRTAAAGAGTGADIAAAPASAASRALSAPPALRGANTATLALALQPPAHASSPKNTGARLAPSSPLTPSSRVAAQSRLRRSAAPPRPAAPAPDLDVALITAIIQHASRPDETDQPGESKGYDGTTKADAHAPGGASCADKSCSPALPDRPS